MEETERSFGRPSWGDPYCDGDPYYELEMRLKKRSTVVDVIIPTCPAFGGELMERCIAAYERLTDEANIIVVEDSPNCGAGWIEGLKKSKAPYVHLTSDDIEPRTESWAVACIESVDRGELPCPVVWKPDGSLESCGGNMAMMDNLNKEMVPDGTSADFGGAPFMSRKQVDQIGMLPIQLCSDLWVHRRGQQLGMRSVVRRDFELIHHRPSSGSSASDKQIMEEALAWPRGSMMSEKSYRVVGPHRVLDNEPGSVFTADLDSGQEAFLVEAGHIQVEQKKEPADRWGSKSRGDK